MAKKVAKRQVVAVPANLEETANFLAEIASEDRTIEKINSELNQKIDKLKTEAISGFFIFYSTLNFYNLFTQTLVNAMLRSL